VVAVCGAGTPLGPNHALHGEPGSAIFSDSGAVGSTRVILGLPRRPGRVSLGSLGRCAHLDFSCPLHVPTFLLW
jgi:hypothetical protein